MKMAIKPVSWARSCDVDHFGCDRLLLWYTVSRGAAEIQPWFQQSWWMKIHVPANFIGYGTFSLAAMVAVAYLLR